jgi:hypothetical protein
MRSPYYTFRLSLTNERNTMDLTAPKKNPVVHVLDLDSNKVRWISFCSGEGTIMNHHVLTENCKL